MQKSRPTRQTCISCDGGKLTIVDADEQSPEMEFILRLPEEILQQIIEYAAAIKGGDYQYDLNLLSILARTCRRLRGNVLPLMHRKLTIDTQSVISNRNQKLRLPLEEPTMSLFRIHCRELHVHIDDRNPPGNAPFSLLSDLVCHLPNVYKITVHGGYEGHPQDGWALIRLAWQNMPHVRSLELSRKSWGLHLRDVFRHIDGSSIQSLHLESISRPKNAHEGDYILAEVRRPNNHS